MLCLQLDGMSVNRQQGRESILRYGDFHLLDSSRPYEVSFEQPNRMLVLSIPQPELARRMPNPESVVGDRRCRAGAGVAGLLSSLLCNFWQQRRTGDETFLSPRFSEAILDLIASCLRRPSPRRRPKAPPSRSRVASRSAATLRRTSTIPH